MLWIARREGIELLARAGEGDVMHDEDDMTTVRADVLGLAADRADRSIMSAVLRRT